MTYYALLVFALCSTLPLPLPAPWTVDGPAVGLTTRIRAEFDPNSVVTVPPGCTVERATPNLKVRPPD